MHRTDVTGDRYLSHFSKHCIMKYSKLTITGVPKSFDIWDVVDYVQDLSEDASPDDMQMQELQQQFVKMQWEAE